MTYPHQNDHQDPFDDVANSLLYGDPSEASQKLKQLVTAAVPQIAEQRDGQKRIAAEQRRSQAALDQFKREEERFAGDADATALAEKKIYDEYLQDLTSTGAFDIAKYRQDHGSNPP